MENNSSKEKIQLLRNTNIFSKLREAELEVVSRYSEYYVYQPEQVIFSEGCYAEGLYIIKEGEVVIKKNVNNEVIDIARYISNECFGELSLLTLNTRTATAIADKETTLLIFPMQGINFKDVLQKHPEISARILHKFLSMIAGRIRNTNRLISEKTPWIRDLRRQVFTDKLTGLYNRTFIEEDFALLLPKYGETTILIIIKPDNFKDVNDKFGHDAGDMVLRLMAIFVQSALRENDIAVRYRGDEFAVILPDTGMEKALEFAEDLKVTMAEMDISHITNGTIDHIIISMGISMYPDDAVNNIMLADRAHERMFKARDLGGNCIVSV